MKKSWWQTSNRAMFSVQRWLCLTLGLLQNRAHGGTCRQKQTCFIKVQSSEALTSKAEGWTGLVSKFFPLGFQVVTIFQRHDVAFSVCTHSSRLSWSIHRHVRAQPLLMTSLRSVLNMMSMFWIICLSAVTTYEQLKEVYFGSWFGGTAHHVGEGKGEGGWGNPLHCIPS